MGVVKKEERATRPRRGAYRSTGSNCIECNKLKRREKNCDKQQPCNRCKLCNLKVATPCLWHYVGLTQLIVRICPKGEDEQV